MSRSILLCAVRTCFSRICGHKSRYRHRAYKVFLLIRSAGCSKGSYPVGKNCPFSDNVSVHRRVGWWWCAWGPEEKRLRDCYIRKRNVHEAVIVGVSTRDPVPQEAAPRLKFPVFFREKPRGPIQRNTVSLNRPPIFHGGLSSETQLSSVFTGK